MSAPEHVPEKPVPCRQHVAVGECDYPYGHDGPHHAEVELPPHINKVIGAAWSDMEKQARSHRRWRYFFMTLTFAQLALYIWHALSGSMS